MSKPNETKILLLTFLVTVSFFGAGLKWLIDYFDFDLKNWFTANNNYSDFKIQTSLPISNRISIGNKILVKANVNKEKQSGVKAFADRDYHVAINLFKLSLKKQPNDPETLIYLNNAKAALSNPIKIAVSIPIGNNLNVSQEILRGVAQSQQEINTRGGINNRLLQIKIANDDNNPRIAQNIAWHFVNDRSIFAVIGHNSSDTTIAVAPIYQQGKLVMISPTSYAKQISEMGDYIFRTVPSIRFQADTLSRYAIRNAKLKSFAVCVDSRSEYSKSLKEDFTSAVLGDGGKIVQIDCDFAADYFNSSTSVSSALDKKVDAILLATGVERIDLAIQLAKANQQRMSLLGSNTMYTKQTIEQGGAAVKDMILAVPWHPDAFSKVPFTHAADRLWGGHVNWRTALAYDATQAAISGLQSGGLSRQGLQKAISSPNFYSTGATGTIEFLPSGDRNSASIIIAIKPDSKSSTGYKFAIVKHP
jgi:branched-chain amino acid transport system substrate-binding protein